MPWAKLHTDILGDPKLMRAARNGMKGLELLPWIIAFAKEADDGGRLSVGEEPAEPVDIANLVPGISAKRLAISLENLEAIGVLLRDSDNYLRFSAWERRSGAKSSDSAESVRERVAAHRKRQREAREAQALATSTDSTSGNALPESGNTPDVTLSNAIEKRRGEKNREEKRRGASAPAGAPPGPPPNGTNGHTPRAHRRTRPAHPAAPAWADRIAMRWVSRIGGVKPERVAKLLGPAIEQRDEAQVLAGMEGWLDARRDAGKESKLEWFAEVAVAWADRVAKEQTEPLLDNGWMSPALERETRP